MAFGSKIASFPVSRRKESASRLNWEFPMEKENHFKRMTERGPTVSSIGRGETRPPEASDQVDWDGNGNSLFSSLFIELVHRINNTLSSIRNITQLSRGKFRDPDFEDYFHRSVTDDIEKIESVINGLLNYVKVSTPVIKSNTVHSILEEVIDKHRDQIEEKKIRLLRKFERDLPETVVHEEQLRYVLNSVLQYAIVSIPSNGSIALLTKVYERHKPGGDKKGELQKDGRYVEVMVGFTGYKKPPSSLEMRLRNAALERDEAMDLVLRLVKKIVQKNLGIMRFDIDERKPQTLISLIFPVERRKIVYYPKANPR
jgi:nitrogen-specific signal transduction histidine kinase